MKFMSILFCAMVIIASALLTSSASIAEEKSSKTIPVEKTRKYESDKYKFSIEYPAHWEDQRAKAPKAELYLLMEPGVTLAPMHIPAYMLLTVSKIKADAEKAKLADTVKTLKDALKKRSAEIVFADEKETEIDGIAASYFSFSKNAIAKGASETQGFYYCMLNGGNTYILSFSADPSRHDKLVEAADKVCQSLKWLK